MIQGLLQDIECQESTGPQNLLRPHQQTSPLYPGSYAPLFPTISHAAKGRHPVSCEHIPIRPSRSRFPGSLSIEALFSSRACPCRILFPKRAAVTVSLPGLQLLLPIVASLQQAIARRYSCLSIRLYLKWHLWIPLLACRSRQTPLPIALSVRFQTALLSQDRVSHKSRCRELHKPRAAYDHCHQS